MFSKLRNALSSALRRASIPKAADEREALLDTMIEQGKYLGAKSAREAAEMVMGRPLSDEEWGKHADDWNRRWY